MLKKYIGFFLLLFSSSSVLFGSASVPIKTIGKDPNLPTVAIVMTGGTIAERTDPKTQASVPSGDGEELLNIPGLKKMANFKVAEFSNIDSSQMTPEMWLRLSGLVDDILKDPKVKGAIVTHGTDTMAEGAFFLDLTVESKKPVVFVGAMRNASDPYTDGPFNLINGVVQVLSDKAQDWGVTVTMNQYINSPRDVEKTQTTNVQTFESGEKGYLGYIFNFEVFRFNDRLYKMILLRPKTLPRVDLIMDYAGSDGSLIRHAVDKGAKGIVIESFGAGNVNLSVFEAVKYAIDKKVAVVITTRVPNGSVFPVYGDKGGGKSLADAGAIISGNLNSTKSRILLMLALPLVKENHVALNKYFDNP